MLPKINFIGCGKLGKTIAKLIAKYRLGEITGVVNSTYASSQNACQFINAGKPFTSVNQLPPADIYFITTTDNQIANACEKLLASHKPHSGAILVHCSGSIPSSILSDAKPAGCYIASVHPVKSFANSDAATETFAGTYCGYEGDDEAFLALKLLFEGIGGIIFNINSDHKKKYHAAMVMANNYLVTLHYHATQNLLAAGVDESTAKKLISSLMTDAFTNVNTLTHSAALTGPIQRGDTAIVNEHMRVLKNSPSAGIYSALGKGTIPLTKHNDVVKEKLGASLELT